MAISPRNPRILLDVRAPPPSPAAESLKVSPEIPEDDDFSGFLNSSRRVPELILPHRILQRDSIPWNPPEIDLWSLTSLDTGESAAEILRSSAKSLGCFQIANHGLEVGRVAAAVDAAVGVFRLPAEEKKEAARSPERQWWFELEDEEASDGDEFFWWSGKGDEMAGTWSQEYSALRGRMEHLREKMEEIARKIELALWESKDKYNIDSCRVRRESNGMIICIRKHGRSKEVDDGPNLNHEMLGALIRCLDCSHSLAIHLFMGASRFRIYSKQAPALFRTTEAPNIVVTIGDQLQEKNGGTFKHVIGKPEYQNGEATEHPLSFVFLFSHLVAKASASSATAGAEEVKSISLSRQLKIAACLLLFYHIIAYFCSPEV